MSFQVTENFVQQYADNIMILSQQRGSVISGAVRVKDNVIGKRTSFERLAATAMTKRTNRHADMPQIDSIHSRRWANLEEHDWADLIDSEDELKLLVSLESPYAINAAMASGRTKDDIIIAALLGTAVTGEEAGGTQVLPAGQKITSAGGLTLAKITESALILNKAKIVRDDRWFVYAAESLNDILNDSTITSVDFNTVRLLMSGNIETFMGYTWVTTEQLTFSSGVVRQNIAFQRNALGLAVAKDTNPRVDPRVDKAGVPMQVSLTISLGAVRVEDEAVVEVQVDEA